MTVPVVYNFRSLSNKIPATLPKCRLGGFFGDFIYFFDPVLFYIFIFAAFAASDKNLFVERNNFTVVGKSFCLRYKLNLF